jgi:Domain of unknown function (DUF4386)
MPEHRRISLAFGVLYLITFATSIPALLLFQPVLDDPAGYIAGDGEDARIYFGVLLELILILANVGTALVLIPILKRQNEMLTHSYVAARVVECVFIAAGIIFVLGIVSLRMDDPGNGSLAVSLAALKDWTFLLGPGFMVGVGNGLILGYLMYRSGLVPRGMAMLGLIGGPLIILTFIGTLFDAWDPGTTVPAITVIPEFLWELSLGVYCAVWGFKKSSPLLAPRREVTPS